MTFAFLEQFIIVSGWQGEKKELRLWHVRPPKAMRHFPEAAESSKTVAFSPDEKLVATSNARTISIWDSRTRQLQKSFPIAGDTRVTRIAFSPDSKQLGVATQTVSAATKLALQPISGSVEIWSIDKGQVVHRIQSLSEALVFMPNGRQIALAGQQEVSLWDLQTATKVKTLSKLGGTKIAISPDGRILFCGGGKTPGITIWNVNSGAQTGQLDIGKGMLTCLDVSPNGKLLACGTIAIGGAQPAGELKIWQVNAQPTVKLQKPGDVFGVKFAASGTLLAVGGTRSIAIVDIVP